MLVGKRAGQKSCFLCSIWISSRRGTQHHPMSHWGHLCHPIIQNKPCMVSTKINGKRKCATSIFILKDYESKGASLLALSLQIKLGFPHFYGWRNDLCITTKKQMICFPFAFRKKADQCNLHPWWAERRQWRWQTQNIGHSKFLARSAPPQCHETHTKPHGQIAPVLAYYQRWRRVDFIPHLQKSVWDMSLVASCVWDVLVSLLSLVNT